MICILKMTHNIFTLKLPTIILIWAETHVNLSHHKGLLTNKNLHLIPTLIRRALYNLITLIIMGSMRIEKSSNFIVKSKRKKSMIKNLNSISKQINLSLHQLSVSLGLKTQYTPRTQIKISPIQLKRVINKLQ